MAQKRKTDQSKLEASAALLRKLEEKTVHSVRGSLGDNWRENLFEILMTRLELAAPHKKTYAAIPREISQDPREAPKFARLFFKTMRNMLVLAKAPASPVHIAAFSILYASVINTFLKDTTKDRAKTMAAVDQRLGLFEQISSSFCA